jgi:hypothetical protein
VRYYFANPAAIEAAKAGKDLPNGAYLFAEVHSAKLDADGKPVRARMASSSRQAAPSIRRWQRDAGWGKDMPEILRNEEWNYAVFTLDKKLRPGQNHAECLACHKPLDKASYTFTLKELAAREVRAFTRRRSRARGDGRVRELGGDRRSQPRLRKVEPEGKLEDWLYKTPPEYTVGRDCPSSARRRLRAAHRAQARTGGRVHPDLAGDSPRAAAGHRVVCRDTSGRGRRDGWAGLWLRVDADRRSNLVLENMGNTGPRGTTGAASGSRSALPAAANASRLAFGVLLVAARASPGSRTSSSRSTKSVVVERDCARDVPAVAAPPRPQPSQALLPDAVLRLAPGDAPQSSRGLVAATFKVARKPIPLRW